MIPNLARIHTPIDPTIVQALQDRKRYDRRTEILPSSLEAIGETPLINLSRLASLYDLPSGTELLGKVEFFNVGGSIKDRIARAMIENQERQGGFPEHATIIEASSGNTGAGVALVAAATGRKCLVTMSTKSAMEKEVIMRALGSDIIRTPVVPWYNPRSDIGEACRQSQVVLKGKGGVFLNQYNHPANPSAHYVETAQELINQSRGHIDYCVMGLGTCGTAAGIGARFRKDLPGCKIVVVEPQGSIIQRVQDPEARKARIKMAKGGDLPCVQNDDHLVQKLVSLTRPWKVEGIGKDFFPPLLNPDHVDLWMIIPDKQAFEIARSTIESEGLLVGGSCGTALAAAIELAKGEAAGKRIAVVLPDGARNYLSTFLDDGWMLLHGYHRIEDVSIPPRDPPRDSKLLKDLVAAHDSEVFMTVHGSLTLGEALERALMTPGSTSYVKVIDDETEKLLGCLSVQDLMKRSMSLGTAFKDMLIKDEVKPLPGTILDPDTHTWLQGLHIIDELERVCLLQRGYVIIGNAILDRHTYMKAEYPQSFTG